MKSKNVIKKKEPIKKNWYSLRIPDDDRLKKVVDILDSSKTGYVRTYVHSFIPPNRIHFTLLCPNIKVVEDITSNYSPDDYIDKRIIEIVEYEC